MLVWGWVASLLMGTEAPDDFALRMLKTSQDLGAVNSEKLVKIHDFYHSIIFI